MKHTRLILMVALCLVLGITLLYLLPVKKWVGGERNKQDSTEETGQNVAGDFAIPVGTSLEHMTVGGEKRTYTAYVPESVPTATEPVDVLIVLHGTGGSGEGIRDVGFDAYADQYGFVTIYPDSLSEGGVAKWDPTNRKVKDIDFIKAIIAELNTLSGGQIGNIYVAGMSNGSVMTQSVGCFIPGIDGIAPVAAGIGEDMQAYCEVPQPVPYIGFYGTIDRFDELEKYESSVDFFAEANGCATTYAASALPNIDPDDGTTVELRVYNDASGKACPVPMHYYRIEGGGHYWPGSKNYREDRLDRNTGKVTYDIDATKLIVEFFGLDS